MPRLRRWVWSVSGDVIDCILVGLCLAVLSCLGSLGVFEFLVLYGYRSPTDTTRL